MRKYWTKEEMQILREEYPTVCGKELSKKLNCSHKTLLSKVFRMKLKKDPSFKIEAVKRLQKSGKAFRFNKGHIPFNKGKKIEEFMSPNGLIGAKKNWFQKGDLPYNTLPVGTEIKREYRGTGKYYTLIKIEGERRLLYKHVHLWECHHQKKVPKGFNVTFKDGNTMNFEIDNLEVISDAELMNRNSIVKYPIELQKAIKLNNKIKKHE